MWKFISVGGLLVFAEVLLAQITQNEIAKPTPADARPNSDKIPDVYAIKGQFKQIQVFRFKYDTELLSSIRRIEYFSREVFKKMSDPAPQRKRLDSIIARSQEAKTESLTTKKRRASNDLWRLDSPFQLGL